MSEAILQLNEELIHNEFREPVKKIIEGTLNSMLDAVIFSCIVIKTLL